MKKHLLFLMLAAVLSLLPFGAKAQDTITIGNGTSATYYPLPGFYGWQYDVYIYTPTDAEELDESIVISSIGFDATTTSSSTGASWEIWLKDVDANYTLAAATTFTDFTTDATLVHSNTAFSSTTGWNTFQLSDDFIHEGGNALLVIVRGVGCTTSGGCSRQCHYTSVTGAHWYKHSDSNDPGTSVSGTVDANRANIQITYDLSGGDICRRPKGLSLTNVTSSDATVNWVDTNNIAGTYEVQLINGTDTQTVATNLSGTSYNLTSLEANTAYIVRVRTICSDTSASSWATITLRTHCGDITLPYRDGFESYVTGSGNFPDCWIKVRGSSTSPYTDNSGIIGHNQLLWSNSSTVDTVIVMTNAIPISPTNMHISMWLASAAQATVGIITDTSDITTFVPLMTVSNGNYWYQYDIYTDTVEGLDASASEVFLVVVTTGTSGSTNLDEVVVEEIGDCRRPIDADFEETTYNSVTVSWIPDAVSTAGTYDVLLTLASQPDEEESTSILNTGIDDTVYTITDLQPYTTYYAWVRINCGGSTSDWYRIGRVTTHRSCYELTDVTLGSVNFNSAYISWNYAGHGRGIPESGVHVIVRDSNSIVQEYDIPVEEGNSAFITGLNPSTSYTVDLRTVCDPDSAIGHNVLALTTAACGEVTGTPYASCGSVPFNRYFKYGYSQMLYPMSAVAQITGGITGIAFSSIPDRTYIYNIDVYIGETDQATLTSSTAIPYSQLTRVVHGYSMTSHAGYNNIIFDEPYVPSGEHANLVIVVDNNTGAYDGSGYYWHAHSCTGASLYYQNDSQNPDPANLTQTLTAYNYRPDIRFLGNCNFDCLGPNVVIASNDYSSVDLRWARGLDETSWAVQYRIDTANAIWVDQPMATDTFCSVVGLEARSPYVLRVGSICSEGDTVWGNTVSLYTDCAPVDELPIVEGFENDPTDIDPLCWNVISIASSTSATHVHGVNTTTPHSGTKDMRFSPYGLQYLISQQLPAGTNPAELEINWWGKYYGASTTAHRYDMGLMTDPTDTSTFRMLHRSAGNSATWTEYTAYTDTITLTADDPIYVAFRLSGTSNSSYTYLDDITIKEVSCRKPTSLHIDSLSHDAVTFSWHGQEDATYEYCITTIDSVPDSVLSHLLVSEDTVGTVTGLTGNTSYYFWVRSICEDTPTPWSAIYTFTTPCTPEVAPWAEDFDDWSSFSACWSRYSGAWSTSPNLTSITSGWTLGSSYGNLPIQGKAIYFNLYSTNKYWAVTPMMAINSTLALSFDIAAEPWSSTYFDADDRFVVAISNDGGTTWAPLYQFGADSARDDSRLTDLTSAYQTFTIPIIGYDGQNVRIAFYGASYASGGDSRILIDNVSLQSTECMRPFNVNIEPDDYSAVFTWTDLSTENDGGYVLVVSPSDSINDAAAQTYVIPAGDTIYTATELESSTKYHYFIRSACGDTVTEGSWTTGTFRTNCLAVNLPYTQDFEDYPTGNGNIPICWEIPFPNTSGSTVYPYITTGTTTGQRLYLYGYKSGGSGEFCIATPKLSEPLNNLTITFDYTPYSSSYAPVTVYLATDPADHDTYHRLMSTATGSTLANYELFTDTVSGLTDQDTGYIVFAGTLASSNYTYGYLDNVYINMADPCRRPSSVSVDNVTYYTAHVTWPAINGINSYRVKYSTVDDMETADSIDVFDTEATLTDLHNGTTYFVWVQAICDEGISMDARGTSFTTEVSCYPITNLRKVSSSATGAAFEWNFVGHGNPVVEVLCEVFDMTDSTSTIETTMGSTYHLIGGLNPSHTYVAKFYTVCDPDTSAALVMSLSSEGDACKVIRGTSTVSYAPFYGLYNYSYSQMLYTSTDVSGLDTLTGIAFRVATTPSSYPQRPINVWIGNTPMTTVNSSTIMNQSQMIQVANNFQFDVSDTGWVTIPFSQPFVHTSGSNIMIAVQNLTGHYSSFSWGAHSTTTGGYTMWYTDSGEQSYASHTGTNNTSSTTMPDIKFLGNCGNHGSDSNLCAAPIVLLDSIDSTAAHIIWLPGTDETSWVAEYKAETDTVWTSDGLINGSEYTFTGLTPATSYIFRLGTVCEEDTVYSTEFLATTECVYEHLPFHFTQADMVAIQTPGLSPCWSYSNFYRSSNTTYGVSYLYTYSTAGLLMLPAIAEPLNSAQLRTHVAATSTSLTQMRVGVMESTGTITWVDTIDLPHAANVGDATEQVVYLDSYTGTGNRVVIGTTSSNYMYFHDLHVEELESCRRVDNLTTNNVGDGSATVSWTAEGQTQWLVYLNDVFVDTTTTPTYTFTDLDPVSDYTVMVRTLCSASDTSRPALTSFSTPCATITAMPWSENFDSISSMTDLQCWDRYSGLFNETTGTATLTTTTAGWTTNTSAMGGSKHTKVNIYGTTCKYWLVTPAIALSDNATLSLDVALTKYSSTSAPTEVSSDDRFYVLATTNNGNTWQVVEKWTSDSTTGGRIYENIPATAQHHTLSLSSYAGMTVRFAFYGESTVSGGDNDLHIDNIVVNSETIQHECDAPVINSANATRNEAVLTWTGTANSYEVAIVEGTWQAPDSGIAVTGTSHTFTGLDELTQYSVGVRAICDDAISDWVSRTVTTLSIDDVANASFSMRPNPATSMVTVEADAEALVAIIDMNGREVYRSDIASDKHHIDVSNLAKGAYFVRVTTQDGTSVRKLIVK